MLCELLTTLLNYFWSRVRVYSSLSRSSSLLLISLSLPYIPALRAGRHSVYSCRTGGFVFAWLRNTPTDNDHPVCVSECEPYTCMRTSFRASACACRCACTRAAQVRSALRYCIMSFERMGRMTTLSSKWTPETRVHTPPSKNARLGSPANIPASPAQASA